MQTEEFESRLDENLERLHQELRENTYLPQAVRDVHNPGLRLIEHHAELFENLHCSRQGMFRLGPRPTGHNPVVRPSRELVPLPPHLLIEGSQQDIAQQWRNDSSLWSSPWSRKFPAPFFIARLQHLLNELQHSAVGKLLSDQGQEFFVIYGSERLLDRLPTTALIISTAIPIR